MRMQDLDALFDLDQNRDGKVSDVEFGAEKSAIHARFQSNMSIDIDGATPAILFGDVTRVDGGVGTFVPLNFTLDH